MVDILKFCRLLAHALILGAVLGLLDSTASADGCINRFLPSPEIPQVTFDAPGKSPAASDVEIAAKILNTIGMADRVEVFGNVPVDNACAAISGDGKNRRLVYVNSNWMETVAKGNDWIRVGIIAHEIGHHVNNHSFEGDLNAWQRELEADFFAGRMVAIMGGTLDQALLMLDVLPPGSTSSHPPKDTYRKLAIEKGYGSGPQFSNIKPSDKFVFSGPTTLDDSVFLNKSELLSILDGASAVSFSSKLRGRPSLRLVNATVDLSSIRFDDAVIAINSLEMINSTLIVGQRTLIVASAYMSLENSIITSGLDPTSGRGGRASGGVYLLVTESLGVKSSMIQLTGEKGADGGAGSNGASGAPGNNGVDAQSATTEIPDFRGFKLIMKSQVYCVLPPTRGLDGEPGGPGGTGLPGQPGGSGGTFAVLLVSDAARSVSVVQDDFDVFLDGGSGGRGGPGGRGGAGGKGGEPGKSAKGCSNASPGSPGAVGPDGTSGQDGPSGPSGLQVFRFLSAAEATPALPLE